MKTKIEIKSVFGKVLFELKKENNSIKETLIEAVKINTDLSRANLSGENISGADLSRANLSGADLSRANLSGADLSRANLYEADLSRANLYGANLYGANLYGANLYEADLSRANLSGAYLYGANLYGANLSGAYISGENISGANLSRANLSGANLSGAKIKIATVFTGLYRHIVIPFISEDNKKYVKMGCFTRTVEEWDADFWNNPDEFPNDGSEKSKLRLFAYETARKWFDIKEF
jgi:hypothetical protein